MARGHVDLPKPDALIFKKSEIIEKLTQIDNNSEIRERILTMENQFRENMSNHVSSLPTKDATFKKFNTSPFVLMIHSLKRSYSKISEIEKDILPAKEFSSMETSAGRMTEVITLPIYGWETVESGMHTSNSALDGKCLENGRLKLVTLKSGPRCLNDEMSENFADSIISHIESWATEAGVTELDFTYGVLYGTKKQSNKKDWHILRNLMDKLPHESFEILPKKKWNCRFTYNGITANVAIKVGDEWWKYLGGDLGTFELCIALIRACISPSSTDPKDYVYTISDLKEIVDTSCVSSDFNISILQKSQLPWLFFMLRHFCDKFEQ